MNKRKDKKPWCRNMADMGLPKNTPFGIEVRCGFGDGGWGMEVGAREGELGDVNNPSPSHSQSV